MENPWNPNQMMPSLKKKVANSLKRFGFVGEVLVRQVGPDFPPGEGQCETSGYQVINGAHRLGQARQLGLEEVEIRDLGVVRDGEAKQLTIIMNGLTGDPDPDLFSKVIVDLMENVSSDAICDVLPYDVSDIEGIARLNEVDEYFDKSGLDRLRENQEWSEAQVIAVRFDVWKGNVPVDIFKAVIRSMDKIAASLHSPDLVAVIRQLVIFAEEGMQVMDWRAMFDEVTDV
jgi:hypothetical protein